MSGTRMLTGLKCFVSDVETSQPFLFKAAFETYDINIKTDTLKQHKRRQHTRSKAFWIIAGVGNVPNGLRAPAFKALKDTECLRNYVGGICWENGRGGSSIKEVVLNCEFDFKTLSDYLIQGFAGRWIGIIDVKNDGSVDERNIYFNTEARSKIVIPYSLVQDAGEIYPYFEIKQRRMMCIGLDISEYSEGVMIPNVRSGKWHFKCVDAHGDINFQCCILWHNSVHKGDKELLDTSFCSSYRSCAEIKQRIQNESLVLSEYTQTQLAEEYLKTFTLVLQLFDKNKIPSQLTYTVMQFACMHPRDRRYFTNAKNNKNDGGWLELKQGIRIDECMGVGCFDFDFFKTAYPCLPDVRDFEATDLFYFEDESDLWFIILESTLQNYEDAVSLPYGMGVEVTGQYCNGLIDVKCDDENDEIVAVRLSWYSQDVLLNDASSNDAEGISVDGNVDDDDIEIGDEEDEEEDDYENFDYEGFD